MLFDDESVVKKFQSKRIKDLKQKIDYYDAMYYGKNISVITDYEYDILKKEFERLAQEEKIGQNFENTGKIHHIAPVLSLKNVYSQDELIDFVEKTKKSLKIIEDIEFVAELKIDGLTLVIQYKNGKAISFSTRGNGEYGEDVSANAVFIKNIACALKINPTNEDSSNESANLSIKTSVRDPEKDKIFGYGDNEISLNIVSVSNTTEQANSTTIPCITRSNFEIRGEVYIHKTDLAKINFEKNFSTSRHAAAGILKQASFSKYSENLKFAAHGFVFFNQKEYIHRSTIININQISENPAHNDSTGRSENPAHNDSTGRSENPAIKTHIRESEKYKYPADIQNNNLSLPYKINQINSISSKNFLHQSDILTSQQYLNADQQKTYSDVMKMLESANIPTTERKICKNVEEMIEFCDYVEKIRDEIPYEVDGIVFKINSIKLQELLGCSNAYPKYAIAYKFTANNAYSMLLSVSWHVGKTGVITPVAHIEPIFLSGVKISNITLHNYDEIKKMDLKIGDIVKIERAGDVIPKIVEVNLQKRHTTNFSQNEKDIDLPMKCPSCDSDVTYKKPFIFCTNDICKEKVISSLCHFVSKDAFNIKGLGKKNIQNLYELGLIRSFTDIFCLKNHKNILLQQNFWGEISISNLLIEIEKSKNIPFDKFLYSINIPEVGKFSAKNIAKKYKNLDEFLKNFNKDITEKTEFDGLYGIGEVTIKEIIIFFSKNSNIDMIKDLMNYVQIIPHIEKNNYDTKFFNKKIAVTGVFNIGSRDIIRNLIESNGGTYVSSISTQTDILIIGNNPGSKYKNAIQLGINVIKEHEFIEAIQ